MVVKVVVIGAVESTKILLDEMKILGIPVDFIFGLDDELSENVSGYYPLHEYAILNNIPFKKFKRINNTENIEIIEKIKPDYIFAIGFSQLISKKILSIPNFGVIGCHPADLPKFRGRAVIVWQMLLGVRESKMSMYMMDAGTDSGDIIGKESYTIEDTDYASDVIEKAHRALQTLCKQILPEMVKGSYQLEKQDSTIASYCLKRTPEDGMINWSLPGIEVIRLIRAVSRPYPGAYTYYDGKYKLIIWRASLCETQKIIYGFPGQIISIEGNRLFVLLIDGMLIVEEYEIIENKKIYIGHRLDGNK